MDGIEIESKPECDSESSIQFHSFIGSVHPTWTTKENEFAFNIFGHRIHNKQKGNISAHNNISLHYLTLHHYMFDGNVNQ